MMKSIILRAAQAIKPHVPSIKFRKSPHTQAPPSSGSGQGVGSAASHSGPYYIEEFQLPRRFKRQAFDDHEIAAVNSGGAF